MKPAIEAVYLVYAAYKYYMLLESDHKKHFITDLITKVKVD